MSSLTSANSALKICGMAATFMLIFPETGHGRPQEQLDPVAEITACRLIAESTLRLACMDRAAHLLVQSHERGELTIINRAQVHEARRKLFGFSGAFPPFFGGNDQEEEISAIESTLIRLTRDSGGRWVFQLADGSEWRQVDNESPHLRAQTGTQVRIRRAAFGSYMLNVGHARAIRVRRQ